MSYPATLAYKNGSVNDLMWQMIGSDGRLDVREDVKVLVASGKLYVRVSNMTTSAIFRVYDRLSWALVIAISTLRDASSSGDVQE